MNVTQNDDKPEPPVPNPPEKCPFCGIADLHYVARIGIADEFACGNCYMIFEHPTEKAVGVVAKEWRTEYTGPL